MFGLPTWLRRSNAEKMRADKAEALCAELVEVLAEAQEYIEDINSLYGEGLEVANWHFNGEVEANQNF